MAATATGTKSARLDIRISPRQRSKIEKAAALRDMSLTQWVAYHLEEDADRDIDNASVTYLSDIDYEAFCAILDGEMPEQARELLECEPSWV